MAKCITPPSVAVECIPLEIRCSIDVATGTFTCKCNDGFTGDGNTCDDINECETDGHLCDTGEHGKGNCTNTPGGFECWCPPPYVGSGRAGDWLVSKFFFTFSRKTVNIF